MDGPDSASDPKPVDTDAGLEAPPPPALDPNRKTGATSDPTADDPGNGAD